MSKRTKHTLKIGLRWAVLGAIAWTIIAGLAFSVMDKISASITGQINDYNQAVHEQVPDTAYVNYEK